MGATVQLKKTTREVPASPFCTTRVGCTGRPVVRLKEMQTGVILDLCQPHAQALREFMPHAYITLDLPEGNHGT